MIARALAAAVLCFWLSDVPVAAEPLRIAHNELQPPLTEVKDGKSQGLSIDIIRAAAARTGIEVDMVPVPLEEIAQTLKDGRADAILGAITAERRQSFDVSSPVLITGGALYVRVPNPTPESLAALAGKTVVTPRTGPLAAFIQKAVPTVNLVLTTDYPESLGPGQMGRLSGPAPVD